MIRTVLVSATAAVVLLGAAGHAARHGTTAGSATLDDANAGSLVSASLASGTANATPATSGQKNGNPYVGLAFLTSAATGESVDTMKAQLKEGKSLDTIAGAKDAQVKTEANGYVRILVDFAVAQGKITRAQADADAAKAHEVIDYLMAADVSTYVTDTKPSGPSTLPALASPSGA